MLKVDVFRGLELRRPRVSQPFLDSSHLYCARVCTKGSLRTVQPRKLCQKHVCPRLEQRQGLGAHPHPQEQDYEHDQRPSWCLEPRRPRNLQEARTSCQRHSRLQAQGWPCVLPPRRRRRHHLIQDCGRTRRSAQARGRGLWG